MTRNQQRLADYLAHIIEAIERIDRYTGDMDEVSTSIGAANSCSFGKLRKGQYSLKLLVDVAPDNVGTYEMGVAADSKVSIDGKDKVSGSIAQGATASFTLVVP